MLSYVFRVMKRLFAFMTSGERMTPDLRPAQMFYEHYSKVRPNEWHWKNFTPKEIACKGTGELLVDYEAMDALQKLRDILGVPVTINSAYRSDSHNRAVGGAPNSQHRLGRAFDIRLTKAIARDKLHVAAEAAGYRGVGDYNTFVHLDTRETKTTWDYRK